MNKAILIAYLSYVALGTFDGLLGVIWPAMSADFGVPLESLGILLLVALVGFVVVSFNNGPLIRNESSWCLAVIFSSAYVILNFRGR